MSPRPVWLRLIRSKRSNRYRPSLLWPSVFNRCEHVRWQNTATSPPAPRAFWTTSRVLLSTAFASSLTYIYGITDAGSHLDKLWKQDGKPRYGTTKDLEKVDGPPVTQHDGLMFKRERR